MLRSHQQEAISLAGDPSFCKGFRDILASVTPGGGKSSLPVIFGLRAIAAGFATKLCWVVPRDSLRKQACAAFTDGRFRQVLGHKMQIRDAGNERDPSRGSFGYATTYQAIGTAPELHAAEFRRHRYVLVLDELHHVAEGSLWHDALGPLVENAVLVVRLSGTLRRDDNKRVAFVRYVDKGDGTSEVDLVGGPDYRVLRYTRAAALAEEASLPIYFERLDGAARWQDKQGVERDVSSLVGAGDRSAQAVFTLLRSDYAREMIEAMLTHWKGYRRENPRSKFLVIAPTIALCREYLDAVRELGVRLVDKATSDDGEGNANIDRLKGACPPGRGLQGLVTVGMAYEGLDCPEITHIACLTQIRSAPWLEQMLARATRVDYGAGPYEGQAAHVWAPDDDAFSWAIKQIREEQAPYVEDREKRSRAAADRAESEDGEGFKVLDGSHTAVRAQDHQTGKVIESDEFRRLRQVQQETGAFQMSLFEVKQVVDLEPVRAGVSAAVKTTMSLKEQERAVRKQLHQATGKLAGGRPDRIIEINKKVRGRFGVSRENMTLVQLQKALAFVQQMGATA